MHMVQRSGGSVHGALGDSSDEEEGRAVAFSSKQKAGTDAARPGPVTLSLKHHLMPPSKRKKKRFKVDH